MEIYKTSLDKTAKTLTGFIVLLGMSGIVIMCTVAPWYGGIGLFAIPLVILIPTYIYSVKGYAITNDKLIIERAFPKLNKEISFSEIESANLPEKEYFKWTIRTAGNGGLFGYTGLYANPKLGNFRMYGANRENRILIVLKATHDKIVLSPNDAGMAEILQARMKKLS